MSVDLLFKLGAAIPSKETSTNERFVARAGSPQSRSDVISLQLRCSVAADKLVATPLKEEQALQIWCCDGISVAKEKCGRYLSVPWLQAQLS